MIILRRLDEIIFSSRVFLLKWRGSVTTLCVGILIGTVTNIFTSDNSLSWSFIYNRLTNTSLPLYYLLIVVLLLMLFFWFVEFLLAYHCKKLRWELLLADLSKKRTDTVIAPFSSSTITWNENITLQLCPDFQVGWKLNTIELRWVIGGHEFTWQPEDQESYKKFLENNKTKRWYSDDSFSTRLTKNPVSFTDSPELVLEVQKCLYSKVQFTNNILAKDGYRKQKYLQEVVNGEISYANSFALQAVVVTSDNKILATKSSEKKDYFKNLWSFSIEEQLKPIDLRDDDVKKRTSAWIKRSLWEELGVTETDYLMENIRVISVFLEGHNLNLGLCCVARLSIDSNTLSAIISAKPRPDFEFIEHTFYSIDQTVEVLRYPKIQLHPTSEYRLFLALSYLLTPPKLARKLFHLESRASKYSAPMG